MTRARKKENQKCIGYQSLRPTPRHAVCSRVVPNPIPVLEMPPILPKMQYRVSASTKVNAMIHYFHVTPPLHREYHKHYVGMLRSLTGEVGNPSPPTYVRLSYRVGNTWTLMLNYKNIMCYYNDKLSMEKYSVKLDKRWFYRIPSLYKSCGPNLQSSSMQAAVPA